jgi:hypothetical protein
VREVSGFSPYVPAAVPVPKRILAIAMLFAAALAAPGPVARTAYG